jgi:hypothetical protein
MGILWKVLVLGMLPLGVWGMSRALRPLKSPRGQLLAAVGYAMVPLPYDSIATGRWDGLVVYAVAPFLLSRVLRAYGSKPYNTPRGYLHMALRRSRGVAPSSLLGDVNSETAAALLSSRANAASAPGSTGVRQSETLWDRVWFLVVRRVLPLSLLLGSAGVFAPQLLPATLLVAIAIVGGSLLSGDHLADRLRTIGIAALAVFLGVLLALPAIVGADGGWRDLWWHLRSTGEPMQLAELARFNVGGLSSHVATFGLLIAALPAVLIGRDWRFHLALRLWTVTFVLIGLTWLGERDWLGPVRPDPHVFLALAAAAVAMNIAVGVAAIGEDLKSYRFGWRQLAPVFAVAGVVLALGPVVTRAGNGMWFLPSTSHAQLLSWMDDRSDQGSFRVLWLGDADVMPGGARVLGDDLGAAVITDAPVPHGPALPSIGGEGQRLLEQVVTTARNDDTVELGRLLAPYAIRYVVVPERTGAALSSGLDVSTPNGLIASLEAQLDLRPIDSDVSLHVFENSEWASRFHVQNPSAVVASHDGDALAAQNASMDGSRAILPNKENAATYTGDVPAGDLYVSEAASSQWSLQVNGRDVEQRSGFGWASTYVAPESGAARLHYRAPLWVISMQLAVTLLWLLLFSVSVRHRANRGRFS